MKRIRILALLVSIAVAGLASTSIAIGRPPGSSLDAVDAAAFTQIDPGGPAAIKAPVSPEPVRPTAPPPAIGDFGDPERSFAARPQPAYDLAPRVVPIATPRPLAPAVAGSGSSVRGSASWYCLAGSSPCHNAYAGGMYAAAGPALRVGDWRGRAVRVCGSGSCVNVRLIDWCQCYGSRVIDLYSDAFRRLAPLSQGTVSVTVSW
jgi:hypothetical protein